MENTGQSGDSMHCKFTIQDSGVGMSEEFVKKSLYHPFAQEHNRLSNQYAGSGLGLVITKSLVDLMKGKITVKSEIGVGTTFIVELDLKQTDAPPKEELTRKLEELPDEFEALQGMHILLCEDQMLNAEIASRLLTRKGCVVEVAENGEIGVEKFKASEEYDYDGILMDIRMPVMDGLEAARNIRHLERRDAGTIPIIAMTANAYAEDMEETKEAGMNAHQIGRAHV